MAFDPGIRPGSPFEFAVRARRLDGQRHARFSATGAQRGLQDRERDWKVSCSLPHRPFDVLTPLIYLAAAVAEIAGCFAFWAWWRLDRSSLWMVPGVMSLMLFAWLLTLVDSDYAGRAYAAYGGVYILASLSWLWVVEQRMPDRWDVTGATICLVGAGVILFGPRG